MYLSHTVSFPGVTCWKMCVDVWDVWWMWALVHFEPGQSSVICLACLWCCFLINVHILWPPPCVYGHEQSSVLDGYATVRSSSSGLPRERNRGLWKKRNRPKRLLMRRQRNRRFWERQRFTPALTRRLRGLWCSEACKVGKVSIKGAVVKCGGIFNLSAET